MSRKPPALTAKELDARATRLATLETDGVTLDQRAGRVVREMGEILIDTKAGLVHGQWLAWVGTLSISRQTVDRCMRVAANWPILGNLASLSRSQLYELAEVAEKHPEVLEGLTPESDIHGTPLKEIDCCRLKRALVPGAAPKRAAKPMATATMNAKECVQRLAAIKESDPEAWAEVVAELSNLVAVAQKPAPAPEPAPQVPETRDGLAQAAFEALSEAFDLVRTIGGAQGKLSPENKSLLSSAVQRGWTDVQKLPAFAPPARSAGEVRGVG